MSRRPYFIRLQCAESGCGETGFYEADTRAEEREIRVRLRDRPWRCVRHTRPGEVLSSSAPIKSHRLVVREERHGKFWREETAEKGGSGFAYGPGFKAFAKDFLPGTRLIVTARVELPALEDRHEATGADSASTPPPAPAGARSAQALDQERPSDTTPRERSVETDREERE